ncbi:MAG: (d)CMP kinase [Thermodesulfobacteriota bacterium]
MKKKPIVTIDGPSGAGKTTVSRELARRLGFSYVDTGALYRGLAVMAKRAGVAPDDDDGLSGLCQGLTLRFVPGPDGSRLTANSEDLTDLLRTPEISMMASAVSARPVVRRWLLSVQRDLGREGGAVFEGRDMGTVIFPEADVKFFLSADIEVRAGRRHLELMQKGADVSLASVLADMKKRDQNDSTRAEAPLAQAPDAIFVDSTRLSADEVVSEMLERVRKRCGLSLR